MTHMTENGSDVDPTTGRPDAGRGIHGSATMTSSITNPGSLLGGAPVTTRAVVLKEAAIVAELDGRLGSTASRVQIAAFVRQALTDLSGSVSPESLPEMAARLAEHRLSAAGQDARVSS